MPSSRQGVTPTLWLPVGLVESPRIAPSVDLPQILRSSGTVSGASPRRVQSLRGHLIESHNASSNVLAISDVNQ